MFPCTLSSLFFFIWKYFLLFSYLHIQQRHHHHHQRRSSVYYYSVRNIFFDRYINNHCHITIDWNNYICVPWVFFCSIVIVASLLQQTKFSLRVGVFFRGIVFVLYHKCVKIETLRFIFGFFGEKILILKFQKWIFDFPI